MRALVLAVEHRTRVWDMVLPKVEQFKYLRVLLMAEGRMEQEMDRRIRVVSLVIAVLVCSGEKS